ncbi:hypothetical protein ABZ917_07230 [Nonomuraea wenchangensis]
MRQLDRRQAGQRSAAQRRQQLLAAYLVGRVVQRDEHTVQEPDPVQGATALDQLHAAFLGTAPLRMARRCVGGYECFCDERMQPIGLDQPRPEQRQVRQHPRRRVRQHRQPGTAACRDAGLRRREVQQQPPPSAEPYDDRVTVPPVRPQQQPRLVRPSVHGAPARQPGDGPPAARPGPQLVHPADVPQVTMQVEPETAMGARMRMPARHGPVRVPQLQAEPLPGRRPDRRRTRHEPQPGRVPREGDGQPRPQQAVGRDPRHVPAQQLRSQMPEIVPYARRDLVPMDAGHGTQVEIDVHARRGARPRPVADGTAGGRTFDHGGRHGELAHAQPEKKARILVRDHRVHQHSPCANGTPNLLKERFIPIRI